MNVYHTVQTFLHLSIFQWRYFLLTCPFFFFVSVHVIYPSLYRVEEVTRDPAAPKRAPSAFLLWSQKLRSKMREGHYKLKNADVSRMLGEKWRALTVEEKTPWKELAEKQYAEYRSAKAAYLQTAKENGETERNEEKTGHEEEEEGDEVEPNATISSSPFIMEGGRGEEKSDEMGNEDERFGGLRQNVRYQSYRTKQFASTSTAESSTAAAGSSTSYNHMPNKASHHTYMLNKDNHAMVQEAEVKEDVPMAMIHNEYDYYQQDEQEEEDDEKRCGLAMGMMTYPPYPHEATDDVRPLMPRLLVPIKGEPTHCEQHYQTQQPQQQQVVYSITDGNMYIPPNPPPHYQAASLMMPFTTDLEDEYFWQGGEGGGDDAIGELY